RERAGDDRKRSPTTLELERDGERLFRRGAAARDPLRGLRRDAANRKQRAVAVDYERRRAAHQPRAPVERLARQRLTVGTEEQKVVPRAPDRVLLRVGPDSPQPFRRREARVQGGHDEQRHYVAADDELRRARRRAREHADDDDRDQPD